MARILLLALVALSVSTATAQPAASIAVTPSGGGLAMSEPGRDPVGDTPTVLLTWTGESWHLRSLSPGDVPANLAVQPLPAAPRMTWERPYVSGDAHADTMLSRALALQRWLESLSEDDARGEIMGAPTRPRAAPARPTRPTRTALARFTSAPSEAVQYRVTGTVQGEATGVLTRLSEAEALTSLSAASVSASETQVEASFTFESVAEWAAWQAHPETEALLASLGGPSGVHTRLSLHR